jgi:hypothetical protein
MCVVGCGYLNLSRGSTSIPPLKYGILYETIPKMIVIVLLPFHLFTHFFLEQWDKNHVHLGVLKLPTTPKVNKDSLSHLPEGVCVHSIRPNYDSQPAVVVRGGCHPSPFP